MVAEVWQEPLLAKPRSRAAVFMAEAVAAQAGRSFVWAPVALTFGVWWYFAVDSEPGLPLLALCAGLAGLLLWFSRARPWLALPALVLGGLLLATAKTAMVATPNLRAVTGEVAVTGIVEEKIGGPIRSTLILAVAAIEGIAPANLPRRLRLSTLRRFGDPPLGSRIAFPARLQPLPSPVFPGGFDYGRQLWLDGIGGTGRMTGIIKVLDSEVPLPSWR